jgi:hypothetical protein
VRQRSGHTPNTSLERAGRQLGGRFAVDSHAARRSAQLPLDVTANMLDDLVPVLQPRSEVDLVFAIAALDSVRIPHLVHNGHFGGLYPGIWIALYNQRTIFVSRESAEAAIQVLGGLDGRGQFLPWRSSVFDRGRMLCEIFLFGWCIPGLSARARPVRALFLALLAAFMLSVALGVVLAASGFVGSWWDGLNRGRTRYGVTSNNSSERAGLRYSSLRSISLWPAAQLKVH